MGFEYFTHTKSISLYEHHLQRYYSEHINTKYSNTPISCLDFYSLLTNLGGAMSVWMGFSFILLVEVLELIFDYIARVLR